VKNNYYTEYYAFGSPMPGRQFNSNASRYGFNGKEKDDELKGSGNSYDFGARIYDPRLGRFLSVDPDFEQYPFMSPYCYAANSPIKLIDEEGKGPRNPQRGGNFRPTLRAPNYLEMRLAIERSNFNNRTRPKPVYQPQPIRPSSAPYAVMNITEENSGEVNPKFPYKAYKAMEIIGKALDNAKEYRELTYTVQDGEYNENTGAWYPPLTVTKVYVAIPKSVQEQEKSYQSAMKTTAQGKLTSEEFKNLPIQEQTMRYNSAKLVHGASPQNEFIKQLKNDSGTKNDKPVSITSGSSTPSEPLKATTSYY
jgi:RHS repeat-associated protein